MKKHPYRITEISRLITLVVPGVIKDTLQQMKTVQVFMVASSLAYTTILSIIPLLAVSFAIFNAFGGMKNLYSTLQPLVLSNLARGTSQEAIASLDRFISNTHSGAVGIGGLIGLIFTSMSMLSSAEKAINRVWQAKMTRSILQRIYSYWFFITLGPLALSVAVGFASSGNLPLRAILPSGTGMYLVAVGIFFFIFKWVPHTQVRAPYALISAMITASIWNLASFFYGVYTRNMVSYNKIYGSLGAIPILLLWIYIAWVIILGGAALTAALQKRISSSGAFSDDRK